MHCLRTSLLLTLLFYCGALNVWKPVLLSLRKNGRTTTFSATKSKLNQHQQHDAHVVPTQTSSDVKFDEWCDTNGIVRIGIQTITTPRSVGGRGLFATRPLSKGSVVASIPSELVITAANYEDIEEVEQEYQVFLTNRVIELFEGPACIQTEWIKSWGDSTGLEIENFFRESSKCEEESSSYSSLCSNYSEKLFRLMLSSTAAMGLITEKGLENDLLSRLENFKRRLPKLNLAKDFDCAAKFYTFVMSRAAGLGDEWQNMSGIVPFFDMLNHTHDFSRKNVDLMTFGDCLRRIGSEEPRSSAIDAGLLRRKDFLLVLTQDVDAGEELLTQYDHKLDEANQMKLWLQYGIPPP
mmetsp:Transcript_29294/g.45530  ORF Transcript_29294/g.45530 Transcript_29294/m.45530 type:complete len:352 (+) Transcript_29294:28-1083(+)